MRLVHAEGKILQKQDSEDRHDTKQRAATEPTDLPLALPRA